MIDLHYGKREAPFSLRLSFGERVRLEIPTIVGGGIKPARRPLCGWTRTPISLPSVGASARCARRRSSPRKS
jgi:hypothetical protein